MITPELVSRYQFFSDLALDDIKTLAEAAEGTKIESGEFVFHEGDELRYFYIVVSAVGPGHVFAWSALVPPNRATASAKAFTPCWLISFDCNKLLSSFEKDCEFGYRMMKKIVQISRDRLLDARIESLVFMA
jgi:CRP/FNR family cyclic AMP-dependent transcriptional regulator